MIDPKRWRGWKKNGGQWDIEKAISSLRKWGRRCEEKKKGVFVIFFFPFYFLTLRQKEESFSLPGRQVIIILIFPLSSPSLSLFFYSFFLFSISNSWSTSRQPFLPTFFVVIQQMGSLYLIYYHDIHISTKDPKGHASHFVINNWKREYNLDWQ